MSGLPHHQEYHSFVPSEFTPTQPLHTASLADDTTSAASVGAAINAITAPLLIAAIAINITSMIVDKVATVPVDHLLILSIIM